MLRLNSPANAGEALAQLHKDRPAFTVIGITDIEQAQFPEQDSSDSTFRVHRASWKLRTLVDDSAMLRLSLFSRQKVGISRV
jgi:hypothetical protein